jgi:hypothetical protein
MNNRKFDDWNNIDIEIDRNLCFDYFIDTEHF